MHVVGFELGDAAFPIAGVSDVIVGEWAVDNVALSGTERVWKTGSVCKL